MKSRRKYITAQIGIMFFIAAELFKSIISNISSRIDNFIVIIVLSAISPFILIITYFSLCPIMKISISEIGQLKKPIKPLSLLLIPLIAIVLLVIFTPITNWVRKLFDLIIEKAFSKKVEPFNPFNPLRDLFGPTNSIFIAIFLFAVLPALGEELIFRGAVLSGFKTIGTSKAVLLSALLFSLFHMNVDQTIYQFVLGIILAVFVLISGSIVASILLHFLNNFFIILYTFLIEPKIGKALENFGNKIYATDVVAILVGLVFLVILMYSFYYINRVQYIEHVEQVGEDDFKVAVKRESYFKGLRNWFKYMFTKRGTQRVNLALDTYNDVPYIGTKHQPMLTVYIVFALSGAWWIAELIIRIARS